MTDDRYCTFRCMMCAPGAMTCVFKCGDTRTCEHSREPEYRVTTSLSYPANLSVPFRWRPRIRKEKYLAFPGGRDFSQWILVFSWLGLEVNLCSPEVPA